MAEKKKAYTFGEKEKEYSVKDNKEIEVWKSPKYEIAKKAVIKMLESEEYKNVLDEGDFWILMNRTKTGKMAYTGLIISHNGCLKINDTLPVELKFNPKCVEILNSYNKDTYNNSLVFIYNSELLEDDRQMIYEVGEVSPTNCKNDYPYAMALKRCMDRVILKNSKLAYSGVYSDSEAEEFKGKDEAEDNKETKEIKIIPATQIQLNTIMKLFDTENGKLELKDIMQKLGKVKIGELTIQEASNIIKNKMDEAAKE